MELKDKNYNEKEDMASIFDSWAETTYQGVHLEQRSSCKSSTYPLRVFQSGE